ncbi:MAG: hypothetical protein IJ719_00610 [Clostridia bacterium]|nr:hypothetical protein [Clostridia bacterium]
MSNVRSIVAVLFIRVFIDFSFLKQAAVLKRHRSSGVSLSACISAVVYIPSARDCE